MTNLLSQYCDAERYALPALLALLVGIPLALYGGWLAWFPEPGFGRWRCVLGIGCFFTGTLLCIGSMPTLIDVLYMAETPYTYACNRSGK